MLFVTRANRHDAITMIETSSHYLVSINKVRLRKVILHIKENCTVLIDASRAQFIDHDILETLEDFPVAASDGNISIEPIDLYGKDRLKKFEPIEILYKNPKTSLRTLTAAQ